MSILVGWKGFLEEFYPLFLERHFIVTCRRVLWKMFLRCAFMSKLIPETDLDYKEYMFMPSLE